MAPDRKDLQRSFLQLLRQANLDRYEALLDLGPVQARQRLNETNQDYGTFEALPDLAIVDRLLDAARRRGPDPILLEDLPDEESLWQGARAAVYPRAPISVEPPGPDEGGSGGPWRLEELPGEEDFRPWVRPDSDTDKD